MTECDKIITVMDIASTKKTNTVATNVTSTASINSVTYDFQNKSTLYSLPVCPKARATSDV